MKRMLLPVLAAILLTGCAKAVPTFDPAQIQASAVAQAGTMMAMTQAAIPTKKPIPPTKRPSPTPTLDLTFLATPTVDILQSPVVTATTGSVGSDPCAPGAPLKPLDPGAAGPTINILLVQNLTKTTVLFYAYLHKTSFGECGGRGISIPANQSISWADMKTGCYSFSAIGSGKIPVKGFLNSCIQDVQHKWTVRVYTDRIAMVGP